MADDGAGWCAIIAFTEPASGAPPHASPVVGGVVGLARAGGAA